MSDNRKSNIPIHWSHIRRFEAQNLDKFHEAKRDQFTMKTWNCHRSAAETENRAKTTDEYSWRECNWQLFWQQGIKIKVKIPVPALMLVFVTYDS